MTLEVHLAPHSLALALTGVAAADYCPLQSLIRGLAFSSASTSGFTGTITSLTVDAYDLPSPLDSPASNCVIPDCSSTGPFAGGCRSLLAASTLPVEPPMLQRAFMRWLNFVGLRQQLVMQGPTFGLWNPALNRSDWVPADLLCDVDVNHITMPALPYTDGGVASAQMTFPPPDGMLSCLPRKTYLTTIDWTAAKFFTSGTLAGFTGRASVVALTFNGDALYAGITPVPLGFFDDSFSSLNPSANGCTSACARINSRCPYIVNGVCERCPLGYWARGITNNQYWYCSACTIGSFCNSTLTQQLNMDDLPFACPLGTFQSEIAQSSCSLCPQGQLTREQQHPRQALK